MPTSLTRTIGFRARHQLRVGEWSEAQNLAKFGELSRSHAHDYTCAVTVRGSDQGLGMVVDLALLDQILEEEVRGPLEGRDLNRDLPELAGGGRLPTCETLAEIVFRRIAQRLPQEVRLEQVRVAEDSTLHADCTGVD